MFHPQEAHSIMPPDSSHMLRYLLELHQCTHVVTPVSWIGDEEPDFFTVENLHEDSRECRASLEVV